jgi:isoleucyl-tRNA synthetase
MDWPLTSEFPADPGLVAAMDRIRDVCSSVSSVRKAQNLRVRLPLDSVTVVAGDSAMLAQFTSIIADEVNVKNVHLSTDLGAAGTFQLQVIPGVLGPRIGKAVQQVIGAVKKGEWVRNSDGSVEAAGVVLQEGEYSLKLVPVDTTRSATLPNEAGVIVLDTAVTPELAAEGLARDVVRAIQQARKDAGLDVSDRITTTVSGVASVLEAVRTHSDYVATETLTTSLLFVDAALGDGVGVDVGDEQRVSIDVVKA